MSEVKSQDHEHVARAEDEPKQSYIEPVTADWRVEAAVKTRWHSLKANPKIILIALFAS